MKKLYMLMFALLVSSKGFCAAEEERPGAGAGAAATSAKPIEDIGKFIMLDPEEKIPPVPPPIQKEEIEKIYDTYAAEIPVVLYTSYQTGDMSDTLQSMLIGLKPGEKILIRGIYYPSTIDSISRCGGVVLYHMFPTMHAGVFEKE